MSTNNDSTQHVQIAVADPTPLGLFGLAVVTMVASAQKLGIVEGVSWVLPWALFCGSFAQLLAGYFDYCHPGRIALRILIGNRTGLIP